MQLRQSQYLEMSLRRFVALVGVAYHRLRDFIRSEKKRQARQRQEQELAAAAKRLALASPSFGYRYIHKELLKEGFKVGRERVRKLMKELELQVPLVRKPRKRVVAVVPERDWPSGRRVQIDATRFSLPDGIAWVYVVQDVASRACLTVKAVRNLSKEAAKAALAEAVHKLRSLGITDTIVVQSDGGSQLKEALTRFELWYNQQRPHSAIGYQTPWQQLTASLPKALLAS